MVILLFNDRNLTFPACDHNICMLYFSLVLSHRYLRNFFWMLIGPSMLATGCGSQHQPSSTPTSVSTALLPLGRTQTNMGTTSGASYGFNKIFLWLVFVLVTVSFHALLFT